MVTSITTMLDKTVSLYGDRIAVVDPDTRISYRELQLYAKAIATEILKKMSQCRPIAIYADKSVISTCALWGIIYAGMSYTFIDTSVPDERVRKICNTLGLEIILTDKIHEDLIKDKVASKTILCINEIMNAEIDEELINKASSFYACSNPLYINFTSGTTGEPKGVVIRQYSVIDFIENFISLFSITQDDIIGNQAPFDFDVSVKDIFSCAFTGATLVIIPRNYFTKPKLLIDYVCDEQVTTLIWAVSAMTFVSVMKGFMYRMPTRINKVLFSGETMPIKHLNYWRSCLDEATFVNLYGPTEITCNCTYFILDKNTDYSGGLPIGIAFPNNMIYLLDEDNMVIKENDTEGEICVSGICLSPGYINNEEQTKVRFIKNPNNNDFFETIYKTGDLGKYGDDGLLYFIGRRDTQIKRLGHRIELGEIEACTERIKEIEQATCIYHDERSKICLFYIGDICKEEIVGMLKQELPAYMIPDICINVNSIPMTKNGKTDRKALLSNYLSGDYNE